jgi:hypothetical protein
MQTGLTSRSEQKSAGDFSVEQTDVLRFVVRVLEDRQIRYALVGSYGSIAYGEYRMTQDIDVLAEISASQVEGLCSCFPPPEWYVNRIAAAEAVRQRRQFNVIHIPSGNELDFMLPGDSDWSRQELDRRQLVALLPDQAVYTAHPEDIILGKLRYYREGASDKHLRDISGILDVSGEQIDRKRVSEWAHRLGLDDLWREVLGRVDQGGRTVD